MSKRFLNTRSMHAILGYAIGMAIGLIVLFFDGWKGEGFLLTAPPIVAMSLALWWGEHKGHFPPANEANRLITLFGENPPPNQTGHPPVP